MSDQQSSPTKDSMCPMCDITGTVVRLLNLYAPAFLNPKISTEEVETPPLVEGEGSTGENFFYLAYGSNLSSKTFEGQRGIKPLSATVVSVPTLKLVFTLPGIAYIEPCFGNVQVVGSVVGDKIEALEDMEATALLSSIEKGSYRDGQEDDDPEPSLVGVVYEVTPKDYATIIATEGGGASYQDVLVDCFPIPSTPGSTSSLKPLKAHTLLAPANKTRGITGPLAQPSARYLELITSGAAENSLPESYRNYLARFKPYRRTTLRQKVGCVLFVGIWIPVVLSVFGFSKLVPNHQGRVPEWVARMNEAIFKGMWWSYDRGFKHVFGDGERTIGEAEEELDADDTLDTMEKEKGHRVEEMFVSVQEGDLPMESSVASLSGSWETI